MDIELEEDRDLVRRIAAGEQAALAAFYECYADPLFAFIYHHLDRCRADAEDVWQKTLLAAIRPASSYGGRSRLFTWLCAIARHKIADHLRRQGWAVAQPFADLPESRLSLLVASEYRPRSWSRTRPSECAWWRPWAC
jgi:DNA-directed RNA polymerase specialized sigma24 family protein